MNFIEWIQGLPIVYLGLLASLAAGLATGVGALPILFTRKFSDRTVDLMMGFGAGIMLAATSFSLIIPGVEFAEVFYGSKIVAAGIIAIGMLLGGIFLYLNDKYIPHDHFETGHHGVDSKSLKRLWLFIIAITIHNFPEGLAVGVGFGGGDVGNGLSLAIGIGLQNMPEGLVVALGLIAHKYSKAKALWIATLTGLVEPIGGLIGVGIVTISQPLLPWGLAFAAGAMLMVVTHEIIPEFHKKGFAREATFAVMIGFLVMMFLDIALG